MSDWLTLLVVVLALGGMAAANARAAASSAITLARSCWARIRSGEGGVSLDRWWLMTFAVGLLIGVVVGRGGLPVDWRAWLNRIPSVTIPVAPAKPTSVVYVYEKDQGSAPSGVLVGLDKLNRQDITATTFEQDTTDANQDVPDQYALALSEAKKAGLPALVVLNNDTVLRVVKAPTTEAQVTEAVK